MTTLWENFSLFPPHDWLQELSSAAGIAGDHTAVVACNWSYGLRERSSRKIADIVIGFSGPQDHLACYVIETKRPGGRLADKDLDPSYYLDMDCIASRAEWRRLIYCVDEVERERVAALFRADPSKYKHCGVVTWAEIAGMQIQLASCLPTSQAIREFVAGSIQYQFCRHGIRPSTLSHSYLATEHGVVDVENGIAARYDHHEPQWTRLTFPTKVAT